MASNRLLRLHEVLFRTGLGRTTCYALIRAGKFPKAVPLVEGGRAVAWSEMEIDGWIGARVSRAGTVVLDCNTATV